MHNTVQSIYQLVAQGNNRGIALACQLLKGQGYPLPVLAKVIEKITLQYLQEYMPSMDYHRFGCSIIDRMTFELIHKRLNEFLEVPAIEVEVCADFVRLKSHIKVGEGRYEITEIFFEEFTNTLFYSIKASFKIGKIPIIDSLSEE